MGTLILGNPNAILQPDRFVYDPTRGYQQIRRWRGPKKKILAIMASLAGTGIAFEVGSATGATWEITAMASFNFDGAPEVPVDIWEATSNIIGKDLLSSPACNGISDSDFSRIIQWIQNPPAPDSNGNVAEPTPALTGAALTALRLLKRGVGYEVNQPILRHTQIVSNTYAVRTAYGNPGSIYQLSSIGVPASFLLVLPASGAGTSNIPGGSHFGYKQKPPQLQTSAYRKVQVTTEWEFGEWSDFLYGTPI